MTGTALVVHVVPYYPPHLGGMENVTQSLAQALATHRRVEVLTTDVGARGVPRHLETGSLVVHRSRAVEVAHTPIAPGILWRLLRVRGARVFHVHVAQAVVPEMVRLAAAVRRLPFVAHYHLDVEPSGPLGRLFLLYKRMVLGPTLRAAARVIVLSDEQAGFVVARYRVDPARVVVVPNGVAERFFVPADQPRTAAHAARPGPDEPVRLLYVGRLSPQKNLPRLLAAVAALSSRVELAVVGDGEDRTQVERIVAAQKQTNVRVVGAATGEQLVDWYRWADVFVQSSDKEGMPLVLLEAMAAGLPIVATDVPGCRELVTGVGLLAAPDPAALARVLTQVVEDPVLRGELAERSRRAGVARSWNAIVPTLEAVYEAVR
jgi:glycosyltransferase involved in cell wall biosynthesis